MADQVDDFDDLVGDDTAVTDEADAGKTPEGQDEGQGGADKPADEPKDEKNSDEGDEDEGDEGAPKDGAAAEGDKAAAADKAAAEEPMVPKKALDSEKRRRRELAARLKKLEERANAEDQEIARRLIPNKETDPAGHAEYVAQQAAVAQVNDRLNFSEYHARNRHGDEKVDAAFEWANAQIENPQTGQAFGKALFAHADPYDYAVSLHAKALEAETGGGAAASSDPEYQQFLAWKASQQAADGKQPAAQAATQQQAPQAERPKSLAQRSSASGPTGESPVDDVFGAEFDR